jgi:lipopolysaccharide export LptBFGC system permease protein LptF
LKSPAAGLNSDKGLTSTSAGFVSRFALALFALALSLLALALSLLAPDLARSSREPGELRDSAIFS